MISKKQLREIATVVGASNVDLASKLIAKAEGPDIMLLELQKDLELEYAAAIQYINHAALVTGPAAKSIAEELYKHADEEFAHAKILAERINYLGGKPSVAIGEVKVNDDTMAMIQQDQEGEETAIQRYKVRIAQAESMQDSGTAQIIREILVDEEEHNNDLQTLLNTGKKVEIPEAK